MNKIIPLFIFLILSCSSPQKEGSTSASLHSLLKAYHEEYLKLYPLDATLAGDNRYNNILANNLTQTYKQNVRDLYTRYRAQLTALNRGKLTANDQMSYDVLLWECDIKLEGLKFKDELMPINQFMSLPIKMGQWANGSGSQPFRTMKDYDNWLARLNDYMAWCDTAIVNMKKGIKEGYTIPKLLTTKTLPQIAAFGQGSVREHLFYLPIKNLPDDFSADEKARLTKQYSEIISNRIIPKHNEFSNFIEKEYLPACRNSSGINAIPAGKEYYTYLIKQFTTTTKSPDEIFALGKNEVERISKEMEGVKNQFGFEGDLKSFFEHLRKKRELMPFTKPEEVISHFNAIYDKMKPNLAKLFDKTPKSTFEMKRVEAYREASASAEYIPGSQDGTRPAVFYVPIPDVKSYNILSDEDLFLHEAIPGHHYQTMLQMENQSLPEFRRIIDYSAYSEGWALYTESLGKELGLYTDPYQYFGMLSAEMHRALRLVVDAGIHSQGWTREQAIQYSKDHEARPEDAIVSDIERYMAMPGQALSYKIGQLKIRELRAKAEKELGNKFVISEFHNQILDSGSLPLQVLENKINSWIVLVKNR